MLSFVSFFFSFPLTPVYGHRNSTLARKGRLLLPVFYTEEIAHMTDAQASEFVP